MGWPNPIEFIQKQDIYKEPFLNRIFGKIKERPYLIPEFLMAGFLVIPLTIVLVERFVIGWTVWADWTGFGNHQSELLNGKNAKTLWDWMGLFLIPVVLALIAIWFNGRNNYAEYERSVDQQRETALQKYIDKMASVILEVGGSEPSKEINVIARTRTLMILRILDGMRRGILVKFLYEAGLIRHNSFSIDLLGSNLENVRLEGALLFEVNLSECHLMNAKMNHAFLRAANLSKSNLSKSNFQKAYLRSVNLSYAIIKKVDFSGAILDYANFERSDLRKSNFKNAFLPSSNLSGTNLTGVNFFKANLHDVDLQDAQWKKINFRYATMPDGEKYNPKIHTKKYLTSRKVGIEG